MLSMFRKKMTLKDIRAQEAERRRRADAMAEKTDMMQQALEDALEELSPRKARND